MSLPSVLQVYSDIEQEAYNRAIRNSNVPPVLKAMEIMAYNADSTAVVFDMTWLFLADDARLTPFDPYSRSTGYGKLKRRATFNKEVSYIDEVKAFEDNIAVISSLSYDQSVMSPITGKSVKTAVTVKMNRSMILLPDKDLMRERLADPRVGLFYSVKEGYDHPYGWSQIYFFDESLESGAERYGGLQAGRTGGTGKAHRVLRG